MLLVFFQSNRYYVSGYFFLWFFQIFHTIELVIMRVSPPSNHSLCRHQTTFYFWLAEAAAWVSDLSYQTNTQSIAETSYRQHHEMRKPYETYQYCFGFLDEKRDLVTSVTKYPCTHGILLGLKISKRVNRFKFSNIGVSLQMWFTRKRHLCFVHVEGCQN